MAIKKVQGGWFCSLTGHTYDSEEAARHYDEIYSRQLQGAAAAKTIRIWTGFSRRART